MEVCQEKGMDSKMCQLNAIAPAKQDSSPVAAKQIASSLSVSCAGAKTLSTVADHVISLRQDQAAEQKSQQAGVNTVHGLT